MKEYALRLANGKFFGLSYDTDTPISATHGTPVSLLRNWIYTGRTNSGIPPELCSFKSTPRTQQWQEATEPRSGAAMVIDRAFVLKTGFSYRADSAGLFMQDVGTIEEATRFTTTRELNLYVQKRTRSGKAYVVAEIVEVVLVESGPGYTLEVIE